MRMPFGKYKGYQLADIPTEYLTWCVENIDPENEFMDNVLDEIESELDERGGAEYLNFKD